MTVPVKEIMDQLRPIEDKQLEELDDILTEMVRKEARRNYTLYSIHLYTIPVIQQLAARWRKAGWQVYYDSCYFNIAATARI